MVKRYVTGEERMELHKEGHWVTFDDYAALEAECARLTKKINDMYMAGVRAIDRVAAADYNRRASHDEALIVFDEAYAKEPT